MGEDVAGDVAEGICCQVETLETDWVRICESESREGGDGVAEQGEVGEAGGEDDVRDRGDVVVGLGQPGQGQRGEGRGVDVFKVTVVYVDLCDLVGELGVFLDTFNTVTL